MGLVWKDLTAVPTSLPDNDQKTGRPRFYQRLRCDKRGATIIEFAAVAAPFLALLLAIFQTTIAMFVQQTMETAVEKSSRSIMTGSAKQANKTLAQFKSDLCGNLPGFITCSNVMIDIRTFNTLSAADTSKPILTYNSSGGVTNSWTYDLGDPGEIVVMRAMYLLPTVTGPLKFSISDQPNGNKLIISTNVLRVENY